MSDTFFLVVEHYNRAEKPTTPSAKPNADCPCGATWLTDGTPNKKYKECCGRKPEAKTVGRNENCLCGSGKKSKKCCGQNRNVGMVGFKTFERVKVADSLNTSTIRNATVIIDILNKKCVKNNLDKAPEEEIVKHYYDQYADKIEQGFKIWIGKQTRAFMQSSEYQNELRKAATDLVAEHKETTSEESDA